jgi:hypothetical protein
MAAAAKSAKATARATDLLPVIAEVRAAGVATLSGIAKALTARGVPTPSGRGACSPATVMRLDRRVRRPPEDENRRLDVMVRSRRVCSWWENRTRPTPAVPR